ncbi:MAG: GTPase, partial [Nitrospinae bacterium]|nr:GTPase [Nitrospinota bacterium]
SAKPENVQQIKNNLNRINTTAKVIEAGSPVFCAQGEKITGKRVLVVEDGPTLTHGGMEFGAGTLAARQYGAKEIIDPRPWLKGTLIETFDKYSEIGNLLPAMGYGKQQIKDLEQTINDSDCDCVVIGTPIDLTRVINIQKPSVRVTYDLEEIGTPNLEMVLKSFLNQEKE